MDRKVLANIGKETEKILEQGFYQLVSTQERVEIKSEIEECASKTRVYSPEQLEAISAKIGANLNRSGKTEFEVTKERSLEACQRLLFADRFSQVSTWCNF